jgi:hypothetical protein
MADQYKFPPSAKLRYELIAGGVFNGLFGARPTPEEAEMLKCWSEIAPAFQANLRRQAAPPNGPGYVTGADLIQAKRDSAALRGGRSEYEDLSDTTKSDFA